MTHYCKIKLPELKKKREKSHFFRMALFKTNGW